MAAAGGRVRSAPWAVHEAVDPEPRTVRPVREAVDGPPHPTLVTARSGPRGASSGRPRGSLYPGVATCRRGRTTCTAPPPCGKLRRQRRATPSYMALILGQMHQMFGLTPPILSQRPPIREPHPVHAGGRGRRSVGSSGRRVDNARTGATRFGRSSTPCRQRLARYGERPITYGSLADIDGDGRDSDR